MATDIPWRHEGTSGVDLVLAQTPDDLAQARLLFREYVHSVGLDLAFQGFEAELADLPGAYAAPQGALMLARLNGQWVACGAFRPLVDVDHANACEMKRLYVRPCARREGLGRVMAQALMDQARGAGYSCMLLDTLDDMEAARELYATLGFVDIPPYYFNPLPGAHYLKVDLD